MNRLRARLAVRLRAITLHAVTLHAVTFLTAAAGLVAPNPAAAATVTRTGTINVSGTISISAAVPSSTDISAAAELSTYDSTSLDSQSIFANATVTRSGNSATITVAVPYTFLFDSARVASARMVATVTIYANNTQAYASSPQLAVPASGTRTAVIVRLAL